MKTIAIMIMMMLGVINASAQTLGMSTTETTYDARNNMNFEGLEYSGYKAEVIHVEYLPDSIAEVFITYAIYGEGNDFKINIYQEDVIKTKNMEITSDKLISSWLFDENQKTGVVSFLIRQRDSNNLLFETKINSDLPATFSEPFFLSTIKRESVALPILSE